VLAVAAVVLVGAAALGIHAPGKLAQGGFTSPSAPSQIAANRLQDSFGGGPALVLLVEARSGTVDSPAVAAAGRHVAATLAKSADVTGVRSYWATRSSDLRSADGREALIVADLGGNQTTVYKRAKALTPSVSVSASQPGPVTVLVGGPVGTGNAIASQINKDLAIAEGLAIPLTALLLILAFGSVVAAFLPVLIGVISIFVTLFVLWALASITNVSIYAINLTTAMGLGLSIDYALLLVNRHREEIANGLEPQEAVQVAVRRAGRTIIFSAATVAAALAALLVFPVYFLRSFAYAGISVVALSVVAAVVVLPALLVLLGPRVNAVALPWSRGRLGRPESPFWRATASRVMSHPLAFAVPVVAVLVLAVTPFFHVHFGTPDDRVLPGSAPARQVGDALRVSFPANASDTLDAVTSSRASAAGAATYSRELSAVPGVLFVEGPAGTWVHGSPVIAPGTPSSAYQAAGASWFEASIAPDPEGRAAAQLVDRARALPPPDGTSVDIGGAAASLVDQKQDLSSELPIALILIALTTFVLLFVFTGSVILPIKALALNALSLTAVLGAIVWVFQDGHLSGLLDFTPTSTSTTMPLLLFCIAFGLSMDYEVFILSRIKELHDAGQPNEAAVSGGLARTGKIVTMAAGILAVTFLAFGLSKVEFIKLFGIGTALAILLDATVIRGVLVPAFMRVAGDLNWWAPRPLRWLYSRMPLVEPATTT
jgi:RND superfamily putative drug exporter